MKPQTIVDKRTNVERHKLAYRYQFCNKEWCEVYLTMEREDGDDEWKLIEIFVSSHNYESNQMTLDGFDNRLASIIVSKNSSAKAWDEAKGRIVDVFYHIQNVIHTYGIHYIFGKKC